MDTLEHLLAAHVSAANENERAYVDRLPSSVQAATSENVQVAYVDSGYNGEAVAGVAAESGIDFQVVSLPEAEKGFVLFAPALGSRTLLRLNRSLPPSSA